MMTRVLVAPDSFKGTYSAIEVAEAVSEGLLDGGVEADACPVADGGEGTLEILIAALSGTLITVPAHDALGREITAEIGLVRDGSLAIVETARSSGLGLIDAADRDPEAASTYGAGELIVAAVAAGAREVVVTVGGSATTDGGEGAIAAIERAGGIGDSAIFCLCDVDTPFERAAAVFGPQKGADPDCVVRLTARLDAQARALPRDPRGVPATGAGGGLSGGLWAAFGAQLRLGAAWILDAIGFDERLARADAVIGGEGRLDDQTLAGKILGEVARRSAVAGVPLHAVVGSSSLSNDELSDLRIAAVHEATDGPALRAAGQAVAAAVAEASA